MNLSLRRKIANSTIGIILGTVVLLIIWVYGFAISVTFNLTVFTERTTTLIGMCMPAAIVIIISCAILNIVSNLTTIAEAKEKTMALSQETQPVNHQKWLLIGVGVLAVVTAMLFAGNYYSEERVKQYRVSEVNGLVARYEQQIAKIPELLQDQNKIQDLPQLLGFLAKQKIEFNNVRLIVQQNYEGQIAFVEISQHSGKESLVTPFYGQNWYACDEKTMQYLLKSFEEKKPETLAVKDAGRSEWLVYKPVLVQDQMFILVFSKFDHYGKI